MGGNYSPPGAWMQSADNGPLRAAVRRGQHSLIDFNLNRHMGFGAGGRTRAAYSSRVPLSRAACESAASPNAGSHACHKRPPIGCRREQQLTRAAPAGELSRSATARADERFSGLHPLSDAVLTCVGWIDRRRFKRGVFPGKRAQNQPLCWAENGSGWEGIVNADLTVRSTAAAQVTGR